MIKYFYKVFVKRGLAAAGKTKARFALEYNFNLFFATVLRGEIRVINLNLLIFSLVNFVKWVLFLQVKQLQIWLLVHQRDLDFLRPQINIPNVTFIHGRS